MNYTLLYRKLFLRSHNNDFTTFHFYNPFECDMLNGISYEGNSLLKMSANQCEIILIVN